MSYDVAVVASGTIRRCKGARLVVILASGSLVIGACATAGLRSKPPERADYWQALAELRPDRAKVNAKSASQRQFAIALDDLMGGKLEEAENAFGNLRSSADDSVLRAASRMAYIATLQYQGKWDTLSMLAAEGKGQRAVSQVDLASVEAWAVAFKLTPRESLEFHPGATTYPLKMSEAGTPLIPVRIAGHDYYFWLDTGASMTIVSSEVARALGLQALSSDTLQMITSTGRVNALPAVLSSIGVGPVTIHNATTMIVADDRMQMSVTGVLGAGRPIKIDGIVGFDVIRHLDFEVNYTERVVRIRNPAGECAGRDAGERNFFLWIGIPVIRMQSESGALLHFGLDTGAQQTFATDNLLDKLGESTPRTERRRVGGMGETLSLSLPVIPELRLWLRRRSLVFRAMVVYEPIYQTFVALDGVLGSEIWTIGRVRMDFTNGVFEVLDDST